MSVADFCFCAPVTRAALEALLEASDQGRGAYRDTHPWLVAQRLWQETVGQDNESAQVALILATQDGATEEQCELSHYALISAIEVVELHRGSWESRCRFGPLQPMNPVWQTLDSLLLWPAQEQREREALEGLRKHRTALSVATLHPYAICETPEFIGQL